MRIPLVPSLVLLLALNPPSAPVRASTGQPVAVADTTRLGIPYTRYKTTDRFERSITFYLSNVPDSAHRALPLVLVIDGSGCQSVWKRVGDRVGGGHQNLMRRQARGRARVMIVEKPGVAFLDDPPRPGSAEGSSVEFRREHTLERWSEANAAALRAARQLEGVDATRVLVCGHSEGGTVAARVAALVPEVTHAAPLSCGGATQLFDLAEWFGAPQPGDSAGMAAARRQSVFDEWARIRADSTSTERMWLGHPYRRWFTFCSGNSLDDLLAMRARLFLAHGTGDRAVPVVAFDWVRAELAARGREAVIERIEGADHGFFGPEGAPTDGSTVGGIEKVFARVLDWFLGPA
ncbi:MAG: alpha/beta fold hydrolase [Candidatus Eisenbacteria bacterium]|nr:alpha/beta fold hydrolase [Candidatus Eisenbacteria bacterium]